jgi:hypothetical protein
MTRPAVAHHLSQHHDQRSSLPRTRPRSAAANDQCRQRRDKLPVSVDSRRMRGEGQPLAAFPQVNAGMTAVCKTVGSAYPGSNPGPATTTSTNSLLISPCSGEVLVFDCPVASGGNRPATVGPGEYVAKSHIMVAVTVEGMVHRLQIDRCLERLIQRCSTLLRRDLSVSPQAQACR